MVFKQLLAPDLEVICYSPKEGSPWKIYLPQQLLRSTIQWYHVSLGHIGSSRLSDTLRMHFYHPKLQQECDDLVEKCDPCQRYKNVGRGHGSLAAREAPLMPWRDVAVDLIGPWILTIGDTQHEFHALTVIDTVTNLTEIVRLQNKTAAHVALHFVNTWLLRYPRPVLCIHDQGPEFIGSPFQEMLARNGIEPKPITSKNPQANSICERMHQTVGNILRTLASMDPPEGIADAGQLVDTAIAQAVYALRCAHTSALGTTPGALAFHRDMILNIPIIADLESIQQNRQHLIDQRLIIANRKRFNYDYQIDDKVLKLNFNPNKLEARASGPYKVLRVHANGTVTIRLSDTTIERISLRRIKPYRQ